MIVSTVLVGWNAGDHPLEDDIAAFERRTNGRVVVARTGYVRDGLPMVRLVGEPRDLLTALQECWVMTKDEAATLLEG